MMKPGFFILFLSLSAFAADEPKRADCSETNQKIAAACQGSDASVASQMKSFCEEYSERLAKVDKQLADAKGACDKQGGRTNQAGATKARSNQRDNPTDQANLLGRNQAELGRCSGEMKRIGSEYKKLSDGAKKNAEGLEKGTPPSPGCKKAAEQMYKSFEDRANERVSAAESRAISYDTAGAALKKQEDTNRKNAGAMGGDTKGAGGGGGAGGGDSKGGDSKKGGGGGGGDPSALMGQAMQAAAKAKQDADAEKQKREAEEKARQAQEKQARIQQCFAKQAARSAALAECDRTNNTNTTIYVPTVHIANTSCKQTVNDTYGAENKYCQNTP